MTKTEAKIFKLLQRTTPNGLRRLSPRTLKLAESGWFPYPIKTIALKMECHPRTVIRCLAALREKGLIRRTKVFKMFWYSMSPENVTCIEVISLTEKSQEEPLLKIGGRGRHSSAQSHSAIFPTRIPGDAGLEPASLPSNQAIYQSLERSWVSSAEDTQVSDYTEGIELMTHTGTVIGKTTRTVKTPNRDTGKPQEVLELTILSNGSEVKCVFWNELCERYRDTPLQADITVDCYPKKWEFTKYSGEKVSGVNYVVTKVLTEKDAGYSLKTSVGLNGKRGQDIPF